MPQTIAWGPLVEWVRKMIRSTPCKVVFTGQMNLQTRSWYTIVVLEHVGLDFKATHTAQSLHSTAEHFTDHVDPSKFRTPRKGLREPYRMPQATLYCIR
jgi:hypothetical protein